MVGNPGRPAAESSPLGPERIVAQRERGLKQRGKGPLHPLGKGCWVRRVLENLDQYKRWTVEDSGDEAREHMNILYGNARAARRFFPLKEGGSVVKSSSTVISPSPDTNHLVGN